MVKEKARETSVLQPQQSCLSCGTGHVNYCRKAHREKKRSNWLFNVRAEDKRRFSAALKRIQTTLHTTGLLSRLKTDAKLPVYMLTGTDIFSASSFFPWKKWTKLKNMYTITSIKVMLTNSSAMMCHLHSKDESRIRFSHKLCYSYLHNCRSTTLIPQKQNLFWNVLRNVWWGCLVWMQKPTFYQALTEQSSTQWLERMLNIRSIVNHQEKFKKFHCRNGAKGFCVLAIDAQRPQRWNLSENKLE